MWEWTEKDGFEFAMVSTQKDFLEALAYVVDPDYLRSDAEELDDEVWMWVEYRDGTEWSYPSENGMRRRNIKRAVAMNAFVTLAYNFEILTGIDEYGNNWIRVED